VEREQIAFWPGGGGELEDSATDCNEYHIVGTWSAWENSTPMEPEGEGAFGFTVTLGVSCFEQFQIWMDGDSSRVLHPGDSKAPKGSPVSGPTAEMDAMGLRWMIDGRPSEWAEWYDDELTEIGEPGDQYRVHLYIAGKWRAVTWEKITSSPHEGLDSLLVAHTGPKYYVTTDFNGWTFQEMIPDETVPGLFSLEVSIKWKGGEFQIIKDKDWFQVFYPSVARAGLQTPGDVMGPDDEGYNRTWYLEGKAGGRALIEFQRVYELGEDIRKVSWRWV
jgi:hypothetical protein